MWYFGVYQPGSNLKRAPVPGICGLWYGFTDQAIQNVFWAVYTLDQDVQWNTLPVFATNHPELGIPFMDTFLNALPAVIEETRNPDGYPNCKSDLSALTHILFDICIFDVMVNGVRQ